MNHSAVVPSGVARPLSLRAAVFALTLSLGLALVAVIPAQAKSTDTSDGILVAAKGGLVKAIATQVAGGDPVEKAEELLDSAANESVPFKKRQYTEDAIAILEKAAAGDSKDAEVLYSWRGCCKNAGACQGRS